VALSDAAPGGGGKMSTPAWLELAEEGALVVFRVLEIQEAGQKLTADSKGTCDPVVCDILIVNGKREGEVLRSEKVIQAGITRPLRQKVEGDDMAARVGSYDSGRKAGANPAGPDGFKIIEALFAEHGDDPYTAFEQKAKEAAAAEDGAPF
jgi:hypothetical protein